MNRTRVTAFVSAVMVSAVAVVLAGCALTPPTEVTDRVAHERFLALLNDTQSAIGGEWQVRDDPTPRACVIPLWVNGERYPALRIGAAPTSGDAAADSVERVWQAQSIQVTRTDLGDVVELKGETLNGELLVLRLSASASTLLGESECRPL